MTVLADAVSTASAATSAAAIDSAFLSITANEDALLLLARLSTPTHPAVAAAAIVTTGFSFTVGLTALSV